MAKSCLHENGTSPGISNDLGVSSPLAADFITKRVFSTLGYWALTARSLNTCQLIKSDISTYTARVIMFYSAFGEPFDMKPPAQKPPIPRPPSPPAQRSEVGGVGRQAGGGPAARCTQRPPSCTQRPPKTPATRTSPAPSRSRCRSLDLPQLRWGRRSINPPLPRSEAKWEGSAVRPGEGPPRVALNALPAALNALPITPSPRSSPGPLPISLPLARPPPASPGEEVP